MTQQPLPSIPGGESVEHVIWCSFCAESPATGDVTSKHYDNIPLPICEECLKELSNERL